ncbi:MAG: hypothetical protein ABEJ79_03490 [Halolamina sp.]
MDIDLGFDFDFDLDSALGTDLDSPAWLAGVATAGSYGLILLALFVLLFVVPYALFLAF